MYKKIFSALAMTVLVITMACSATGDAVAADSSIAVLNIQEIMRQSKAAQSVRDQLEKKQKQFQQEMSAKEEALQKEDQELVRH